MMLKSLLGAVLLAIVVAMVPEAQTSAPDVRLREAQQKEIVEGDLPGAIEMYRQLADDRTTPPEIAARALLQLGGCYERLGRTEARKVYERILAEFTAQSSIATEARVRLAAIPPPADSPLPGRGINVRRIPVDVSGVLSATLTADGRYAAVVRQRANIELLDLTTGQRVPFSSAPATRGSGEVILNLAISPDGQQVVFDVPAGLRSELRVFDRRSTAARTIMRSETAFRRLIPIDWARNGRTVLVNAFSGYGTGAASALYLVDVDSGTSRVVAGGTGVRRRARLSPDAKFIAYMVLPDSEMTGLVTSSFGKIYVEHSAGSPPQLVAAPDKGAMLAGWSADSQHVMFVADDFGTDHLWAVRVQDGRPTGTPVSLAKGIARGVPHTITAAGSFIFTIPGTIKWYTAAIDPRTGATTAREELISGVNGLANNAAWSPDGQRLVYAVMPSPDADVRQLYLRDAGSSEDRLIGTVPALFRKLAWTPDGRALLLAQPTNRGTATTVLRYWVDERRSEVLVAAEPFTRLDPKLDPAGRHLYYFQGTGFISGEVIQRDLATGRATRIAVAPSFEFDLAPDGEQLVIQHADPQSQQTAIRVIRRDGQFVRDLTRLSAGDRVMSLAWSADGRWIYFTRGNEAGATIYRVDAAGGVPTSTGLTMNMANAGQDLVLHPNGRQLAFIGRTEPELWRIDGIDAFLSGKRATR